MVVFLGKKLGKFFFLSGFNIFFLYFAPDLVWFLVATPNISVYRFILFDLMNLKDWQTILFMVRVGYLSFFFCFPVCQYFYKSIASSCVCVFIPWDLIILSCFFSFISIVHHSHCFRSCQSNF